MTARSIKHKGSYFRTSANDCFPPDFDVRGPDRHAPIAKKPTFWFRHGKRPGGSRPVADVWQTRQTARMDDSVRSFNEERTRLAAVGGPAAALKRQILSRLANLIAFSVIIGALMTGLGFHPRNSNNSIKLIYYSPILIAVGCAAALFLRGRVLDRAHLRPVLWGLVMTAAIAVPAGLIDAVMSNGS